MDNKTIIVGSEQTMRLREFHKIAFINRAGVEEAADVIFIDNTGGRYCLTVSGRVIGPPGGSERKDNMRRELRLATGTDGYLKVGFRYSSNKNKGWFGLHKLMAKEFLEKPIGVDHKGKSRNEVNHIDGDILNNKISNLCWMSSGENQNFNRILNKAAIEKLEQQQ